MDSKDINLYPECMDTEVLKLNKNADGSDKCFAQSFSDTPMRCRVNTYGCHADSVWKSLAELKAHDRRTYEHSLGVGEITFFIAEELGDSLPKREADILLRAALLHDYGKIGVEVGILNKVGKLSCAEMDEIKKHPEIGYAAFRETDADVACIVRAHHKHQKDPYPHGDIADVTDGRKISDEKIYELSRMLAMIDGFQAMLSNRPGKYRVINTVDEVICELINNFGSLVDLRIIGLLEKYYHKECGC